MLVTLKLPDISTVNPVEIIQIYVKVGDHIAINDNLIALETDKATVDIPATAAGVVSKILVKCGSKIIVGNDILVLETLDSISSQQIIVSPPTPEVNSNAESTVICSAAVDSAVLAQRDIYASPSVRRLARECNLPLLNIKGSGQRGRITAQDVYDYQASVSPASTDTTALSNFGLLGEIELLEMSKIQQIVAENMQRNWQTIPHVTIFEQADISALEIFRQNIKPKPTILPFIVQIVIHALMQFPTFNASLVNNTIVCKKYYNIGIATDTVKGLLVPVIKNANQYKITALYAKITELTTLARAGNLRLPDMQHGTFTISSLGSLGTYAFTPIINAPEVAILGVSRAQTQAAWDGKQFVPKTMLPLSLSFDHRVIDGALATKFLTHITALLSEIAYLLI